MAQRASREGTFVSLGDLEYLDAFMATSLFGACLQILLKFIRCHPFFALAMWALARAAYLLVSFELGSRHPTVAAQAMTLFLTVLLVAGLEFLEHALITVGTLPMCTDLSMFFGGAGGNFFLAPAALGRFRSTNLAMLGCVAIVKYHIAVLAVPFMTALPVCFAFGDIDRNLATWTRFLLRHPRGQIFRQCSPNLTL